MIEQLARQVTLLEEYAQHAFIERKTNYLPEIATKLRVLLVRSRTSTPLLLEVADQLKYPLNITLDGPPLEPLPGEPRSGETITLDRFFDMQAVTIQTATGLVSLTKREVIRAWCEQLGGAHEDWSVDESIVNALQSPFLFDGQQPLEIELSICTRIAIAGGKNIVNFGRERFSQLKN
jgi:hypothetical protein